jgi:hypothetical protein
MNQRTRRFGAQAGRQGAHHGAAIRGEDGFHLWSDAFDGDLTDVFAVQERIARAITVRARRFTVFCCLANTRARSRLPSSRRAATKRSISTRSGVLRDACSERCPNSTFIRKTGMTQLWDRDVCHKQPGSDEYACD